jgi:hypothetical protein
MQESNQRSPLGVSWKRLSAIAWDGTETGEELFRALPVV